VNRFIIADPTLCIGCHTCEAACSESHRLHGLPSAPRLRVMKDTNMSAPQTCRHCEEAPCALVCPVDAFCHVKGTVQLNTQLCISCKLCGIACSFGTISFFGSHPPYIPADVNCDRAPPAPPRSARTRPLLDWEPGTLDVAVKCDLCFSDENGPACIRTCPTKALSLFDNNDLDTVSRSRRKSALKLESPGALSVCDQQRIKK